jgi:hypothetical protein
MSKPTMDGKKHISEKPKAKPIKAGFTPMNLLDVPPDVQADLNARGLEARWVDAKTFASNGNIHKNLWELYKRPDVTVSAGANPLTGLPPDGTVRRGTVVLAVRSVEMGDGHRAELKKKIDRAKGSVKQQGAEMKALARKGGLDERIIDETIVED